MYNQASFQDKQTESTPTINCLPSLIKLMNSTYKNFKAVVKSLA